MNFTQISVQTLSMMLAEHYKTFCTEENVVASWKDAIPKNTRKHTSWDGKCLYQQVMITIKCLCVFSAKFGDNFAQSFQVMW